MQKRNAPPGRGSASHEGTVKPRGPNQRESAFASVHAANTHSRGASRTRVTVTVRSLRSTLLLGEGLEVGKAGLELSADHAIHVDEYVHDLREIRHRPGHRP